MNVFGNSHTNQLTGITTIVLAVALCCALVSVPGAVSAQEGASFEIVDSDVTAPDKSSGAIVANVTVANTGSLPGVANVEFVVDGVGAATGSSQSLRQGEQQTIRVTVIAFDRDVGEHEYTISTGSDSVTGTVTVGSPAGDPEFEVANVSVVRSGPDDDAVTATVEIENTGNTFGVTQVGVYSNVGSPEVVPVIVPSGGSTTFEVTFSGRDRGSQPAIVLVFTGDDTERVVLDAAVPPFH